MGICMPVGLLCFRSLSSQAFVFALQKVGEILLALYLFFHPCLSATTLLPLLKGLALSLLHAHADPAED